MYEMQLQFGSEWSGFTPDIDAPTDTPLETAIKRVIKRMIQPLPADRMSMAEVVRNFSELRSKYNPHVESKDASSRKNVRPSASRGNGSNCGNHHHGTSLKNKGPFYVENISTRSLDHLQNGDSHYMRGLNIHKEYDTF